MMASLASLMRLSLPAAIAIQAVATAELFDYIDTSTWPDVCLDSTDPQKPQQSPIDIPMTGIQSAVDVVFTKLVEGRIALHQELRESPDGNLAMILSSNLDSPASFMYNDVEYHYNHIHSHWGSSEHLVDGVGTHGNFHIVFQGEAPLAEWKPTAVIEVMVNFVDEIGDGVLVDFPRCPGVVLDGHASGSEDGHRSATSRAACPMYMPKAEAGEELSGHLKKVHQTRKTQPESNLGDNEVCGSEGGQMNLLQAMGWPLADFGSVVHYQGSLTTPPCSGPVQWFVQTEPVRIHDPEGDWCGCDSFRDAFPHGDSADVPGNYRPPQMIKEFTFFETALVQWPADGVSARGVLRDRGSVIEIVETLAEWTMASSGNAEEL